MVGTVAGDGAPRSLSDFRSSGVCWTRPFSFSDSSLDVLASRLTDENPACSQSPAHIGSPPKLPRQFENQGLLPFTICGPLSVPSLRMEDGSMVTFLSHYVLSLLLSSSTSESDGLLSSPQRILRCGILCSPVFSLCLKGGLRLTLSSPSIEGFFCLMAAWLNEGRCPGGRPSVSTN